MNQDASFWTVMGGVAVGLIAGAALFLLTFAFVHIEMTIRINPRLAPSGCPDHTKWRSNRYAQFVCKNCGGVESLRGLHRLQRETHQ